ncbi:hypothetical protein OS493_030850 [Desmophyllum pertusum]|uniref:Uncharacterized protein n=1 Tax=Desmophyllum pertusum TaxID=174260 RepID=A0A9W9YJQ8_9CNID|nr:hypothetical protein OS493_030850 [Desmophyllum pertusum]
MREPRVDCEMSTTGKEGVQLEQTNRRHAEDTPLSDVPPAPLLLYRSSNVLVFRPAPFKSNGGEKVRNID